MMIGLSMLPLIVALSTLFSSITVDARWPNVYPFIDECRPAVQQRCSPSDKGTCTWDTSQYPVCIDAGFQKKFPPIGSSIGKVGVATKFFKFSWGVHLSEGSNQQWIYNVDVETCARRCLLSASVVVPGGNGQSDRIRCLSFDFYPHETPKTGDPWNESIDTGMCILNSENRDTARLRNEDLGYSDAEYFYKSHFSQRPFSDYDGYYEIRDPRGNVFEKLLNYNSIVPELDLNPVWGKSRWGIVYFEGPLRKPPVTEKMCVNGADDSDRDPVNFVVGFTPITDEQHCGGLQTKQEAIDLCASASGYLCSSKMVINPENNSTYRPLDAMFGKKIGCGYDGQDTGPGAVPYQVWASEDKEFNKDKTPIRKFTRCCAQYTLVAPCEYYKIDNINFCSTFKTASECSLGGTGRTLQYTKGFGTYLDEIRADCQRNPDTKCSGAVVRDWFTRDNCVWCVQPGYGQSGGAGSCRPGGDFGICSTASNQTRNMFSIRAKRLCGGTGVICPLVKAFPDLKWLYDPEPTAPIPKDCSTLKEREACDLFGECSWNTSKKICFNK